MNATCCPDCGAPVEFRIVHEKYADGSPMCDGYRVVCTRCRYETGDYLKEMDAMKAHVAVCRYVEKRNEQKVSEVSKNVPYVSQDNTGTAQWMRNGTVCGAESLHPLCPYCGSATATG